MTRGDDDESSCTDTQTDTRNDGHRQNDQSHNLLQCSLRFIGRNNL